ncbi:hypothetical protein QRD89_07215 [Halobacillus sp. ACCC02827]|uniref:hypothetical protein n=1 Tax=Halobacillus sp. ACCC02827 TaxID=3052090 RepID=UPI00256FCBF9|nr:hypothetical protein [Halobacillus sp. ACCC02827]WJE17132.1 hypothetical protein QRD89_07215 [Halobacillus sp. ACCC02827]
MLHRVIPVDKESRWQLLSILCACLGAALWLPNFLLNYGYGFWMGTFIINPIGVVFGILGGSRIGIVLNSIMTFSFLIFMFVGYSLAAF